MPTPKDRAERSNRQADEVEASQANLRASIAETQRLVEDSDKMLRRHRKERDEADEQSSDGHHSIPKVLASNGKVIQS